MIYLSIDTETTGLDENLHQIIEFAAIIEDTNNPLSFDEIPKFRRIVLDPYDKYYFSSYACNLNKGLMETISIITSKILDTKSEIFKNDTHRDDSFCFSSSLEKSILDWLISKGVNPENINMAGKNPAFDKKFLMKLFRGYGVTFSHRVIDPALSYVDWEKDKEVPSTSECKIRAGLDGVVAHNALQDAWDVIQLVRFANKTSDIKSKDLTI